MKKGASQNTCLDKYWFCLISLLMVLSLELVPQTRRALLVGIDIYQPSLDSVQENQEKSSRLKGRGSWDNLNGAVNDMKAMRDILIARFGFKPGFIRVLQNDSATRKNIIMTFKTHLIDSASPGDICLFFYAGHGSQVANSSTREEDGLDESLVPADSHRGARDIRDKELWKLYNAVQEKGACLTAIVDSCHSGSISRGLKIPVKYRYLSPDLRDAADPTWFEQTPAEKGALIISATQDFEQAAEIIDEDNHNHGLFTWALLKTLRSVSVSEPANRILLRVKALMRAQGKIQEPNIEATPERKKAPLFGIRSGEISGQTIVAVQKVFKDKNRVSFLGGMAAGIRKGCELKRFKNPETVRVRITEVRGLSLSFGDVIQGDINRIASGDLFEIDRWVIANELRLRLYIPKTGSGYSALKRLAQQVYQAIIAKGIAWVSDPTTESPSHIMFWEDQTWKLRLDGAGIRNLGVYPLDKLLKFISVPKPTGIRFFLSLPPPIDLYNRMVSEIDGDNSLLKSVDSAPSAHYILTGQYRDGLIGYALLLPNVSGDQSEHLPLPTRTDWVVVEGSQGNLAGVVRKLKNYTGQIMKIRAWLEIDSPPDEARFPYHLALKNVRTGRLKTEGIAYQGEIYGLVLKTDNTELSPNFDFHYVYVFTIDKFGRSNLLFPNRLLGGIENKFPAKFTDGGKLPAEIQLGNREIFSISGDAFGINTFILLTCLKPIPDPEVLHSEGVRTRGMGKDRKLGGSMNPLRKLLNFMTAPKRGISIISPRNWSIERISILSRPKQK